MGLLQRSTLTTLPWTKPAPNFSACARISAMRSGPMMPSRWPGKFSTIVVSMSCPPASSPSMRSGCRLARAAYRAAVRPAGPDPMMTTVRTDMHVRRGGFSRPQIPRVLNVFVDCFLDVFLRHQPDERLDDLAPFEQQQRRNAPHAE